MIFGKTNTIMLFKNKIKLKKKKTNGANLSPTHNEKPSSITPTASNSYPAKFSLDPMAPSQFTDM